MIKIDLCQQAVTLDEFNKLTANDILPLVVVLEKVESYIYEIVNRDNKKLRNFKLENYELYEGLRENYYDSDKEDEKDNTYLLLDRDKIVEYFNSSEIAIDKFIDIKGNVKSVDYIYGGNLFEDEIKIKLTEDNNKLKSEIISLDELQRESVEKYIKKSPRGKVYKKKK